MPSSNPNSKPSRQAAVRNAQYSGKHSVTISADTSAIDAMFDQLEGDINAAVRPAAQAGAEVLYQAVRANVRRMVGRKTGNLYDAIYQAFSESNSKPGKATYHVSWRTSGGGTRAPHGHLVEFGHIQRYAAYLGKDGNWHTAIRPSMRGRPRPSRNASQSVKDAYYVLRKGGPQQIAAKPFVRSAAAQFDKAVEAARARLLQDLKLK